MTGPAEDELPVFGYIREAVRRPKKVGCELQLPSAPMLLGGFAIRVCRGRERFYEQWPGRSHEKEFFRAVCHYDAETFSTPSIVQWHGIVPGGIHLPTQPAENIQFP